MNRSLPRFLFVLLFACISYFNPFRPAGFAAAQVKAQAAAAAAAEEQEYIESKLFPKKGKYLDWIEANKLNNQGLRFARTGHYKDAVPMFQKAIQRYSHDYTYYENLGAALHKSGNLERAETTTEMATQLSPRRWGPWYNLGIILTKEHEYSRALKALKRAQSLHAPASKRAGMSKLITALEKKVNRAEVSPVETAAEPSTVSSESEKPEEDKSAQSTPPSADSTSGINPSPAQNSNANPYTTIPAVSPVPQAPATTDKGN